MKAICVLYGGDLKPQAFEALPNGKSAFSMAAEVSLRFPGVEKTVLLCNEEASKNEIVNSADFSYVEKVCSPSPLWTKKSLLEEITRLAAGYTFVYFAWADCPLLDSELAASLAIRHTRYAADYSYSDGLPYGFAPELLSASTAGILSVIAKDDETPVSRDALFSVIQKDINSFDIETEISSVDLREHRLCLAADNKRNFKLLSNLMQAGLSSSTDAENVIGKNLHLLRTLPAFYNIQIVSDCPQTCALCPWPKYRAKSGSAIMAKNDFTKLLDKIEDFSGDAVISLSLWGEPALHPEKIALMQEVLSRRSLSLLIETSGIGWKEEELKTLSDLASNAALRINGFSPISWIVSLDAYDPERYKEVRGAGFAEAKNTAKKLFELFPSSTYVQALRVSGFEDDIEKFYRYWKDEGLPPEVNQAIKKDGSHIIIQKYDHFSGALPDLSTSDLRPLKRLPCWHIQRDMNILVDGTVPCCREDLGALEGNASMQILGNALTGFLSDIWKNGQELYREHCACEYSSICANCDEYYTYNF